MVMARASHSPGTLGFDRADLRALGTMALGALLLIPTTAYLAGGLHFGSRDWVAGLDLAPLWRAGPMVAAHIGISLCTLGLGVYVLSRRKGGVGHRWMGRVWAGFMLGVAITGMAIEPLRFSPAHGAALLVFVMVPLAIRKVRRGDLRGHRRAIAQLLIALVIVGVLALMPGQLLHTVFFSGQ
jgi:uncharacterized membrane protein